MTLRSGSSVAFEGFYWSALPAVSNLMASWCTVSESEEKERTKRQDLVTAGTLSLSLSLSLLFLLPPSLLFYCVSVCVSLSSSLLGLRYAWCSETGNLPIHSFLCGARECFMRSKTLVGFSAQVKSTSLGLPFLPSHWLPMGHPILHPRVLLQEGQPLNIF